MWRVNDTLIAERGAFLAARHKPKWTNPYVTDGLVAMWDGEWNAGGGVHSATTSEWMDICGNQPALATLEGNVLSYGDKWLVGSDRIPFNSMSGDLLASAPFTCEAIVRVGTIGMEKFFFSSGIRGSSYGVGISASPSAINFFTGNMRTQLSSTSVNVDMHCAISRDGTEAQAWKNGVSIGTCGIGNSFKPMFSAGFRAAKQNTGDYGYSRLYCLRIYSRALTAEEIAANYAVDKARFNLP